MLSAILRRRPDGNVFIDVEGRVICQSQNGNVEFTIPVNDINPEDAEMHCVFENNVYNINLSECTGLFNAENEPHSSHYEENSTGKFVWSRSGTLMLLNLYDTKRPKVGKTTNLKTFSAMWKQISTEMSESGIPITPT